MKTTGYLFCNVAYDPIKHGEMYRVISENGSHWEIFCGGDLRKVHKVSGRFVGWRKSPHFIWKEGLPLPDLIASARVWRADNGYEGKGGVIVFYKGKMQSWVNELRAPGDWVSGCIAVDEYGNAWETGTGDDPSEPLLWLPLLSPKQS
ncbi:hypothetical protein [Aeromonas caviae]|uniref:hypothetical protein n=1 Tax=Aeromonas caviae TaxID=648 RepID=UPI0030DBAF54